jgi:hypothetical protein
MEYLYIMQIKFSPQTLHSADTGYRLLWLKLRGSSQFHQPNAGTVAAASNIYIYTYAHTHIHSMHICVCVCVCVCDRLSRYWICFSLRGKWMQQVSPEIIWPTFDAKRTEGDSQCTHYVTFRRVRAKLLTWKISYYIQCVFVALSIQHAMRMCHIVICRLSGSTVFFHIIS